MADIAAAGPAPRRARLWFGLLGGALAWLLHLLLSYLIAEWACVSGRPRFTFLGIMGPAWLLIGVSVVLLGAAIAATLFAWRDTRRPRGGGDDPDTYLARAGAIMSALFTFIIAVETLPILFYLESC